MDGPKRTEKEDKAYKIGRGIFGPFLATIALIFGFSLPIWMAWNRTLCDIFPLFNKITYLQSAGLCTVVWCLGRVWKGVPDDNK